MPTPSVITMANPRASSVDEAFLEVEHQVEAGVQRGVNALIEQSRWRALLAHAVWGGGIGQQWARSGAGPGIVRFDVGAGHRDGVAGRIGAAVHDACSGPDERAQLS
jgi:hypothetical protein